MLGDFNMQPVSYPYCPPSVETLNRIRRQNTQNQQPPDATQYTPKDWELPVFDRKFFPDWGTPIKSKHP